MSNTKLQTCQTNKNSAGRPDLEGLIAVCEPRGRFQSHQTLCKSFMLRFKKVFLFLNPKIAFGVH